MFCGYMVVKTNSLLITVYHHQVLFHMKNHITLVSLVTLSLYFQNTCVKIFFSSSFPSFIRFCDCILFMKCLFLYFFFLMVLSNFSENSPFVFLALQDIAGSISNTRSLLPSFLAASVYFLSMSHKY